jgi:hypothetical protein
MMTLASEAVACPVTGLADLGSAIDELVELQRRAAEIERRAKVLRGEVKEGLARYGVRLILASGQRIVRAVNVVLDAILGPVENAEKEAA